MTRDILGASAATLFYKANRNQSLKSYLESVTGINLDDEWSELTVDIDGDKIYLQKLKSAPGNKASVTILKIYNYLKGKFGESVRSDSRVDDLLNSDYSIGIVFEPNIKSDDKRLKFVANMAESALGVTFDGDTLLNYAFEPL